MAFSGLTLNFGLFDPVGVKFRFKISFQKGPFRALIPENAKAKYNDSTKKQKITLKKVICSFFSRNYVLHCVPKCQSLFMSQSSVYVMSAIFFSLGQKPYNQKPVVLQILY